MIKYCDTCIYQPKCEKTKIQLCLLKDNEHVKEIADGKHIIVVDDWT